jgi:predicted phosphoadenosine phosphosulfate sulfurtransferase
MLHLVMQEAKLRNRRVGVLFIDLEAQYRLTIEHIEDCYKLYAEMIDPHWISLPISLRNAVSQFEPKWLCWDPHRRGDWVREPSVVSITDPSKYPFFRSGMEFEELAPEFGHWYANGQLTACLVGIRADESLNRFRTLIMDKSRFENISWTTWVGQGVYNVYPIYDWKTADIWTYNAHTNAIYNRIYDRMHKAGLSIDQMRICQPYGDDQRKGLWLYSVMEPETWGRVVARVNGANSGALYAHETGVMAGRIKITKPVGHTWQSYAVFLLESMPPKSREHFENKIAVFLRWYVTRGYPNGIPDEADAKAEAARDIPTWRRICRAILKNDYWCKSLSFGQHKSTSYDKYLKVMKARRARWGI